MKKRTRRFTVGPGKQGPRHLRILSADESTKHWANQNAGVLQFAVQAIEEETGGADIVVVAPPLFAPLPANGLRTTAQLAARFAEIVRQAYPEEAIEVCAESPQPESEYPGG